MKRETPKEVWLHHNGNEWTFSFDPPLKRFRAQCVRFVPDAEAKRLRAALRQIANGRGVGVEVADVAREALKVRR